MCMSNCGKIWTALHILWSAIYVSTGVVQIVTGIFFVISIPVFKLSSNIWVGSWNVLIGISGGMLASFGKRTAGRQEILLYFTISILLANIVNAIVSEWYFYTRNQLKDATNDDSLYSFIYYARLTTGLCAATIMITGFVDSQLTFCSVQCMQTANKRKRRKNQKGSHEQVSDIEYIIPRPKTHNAPKTSKHIYNAYAQSWVFDADANISANIITTTANSNTYLNILEKPPNSITTTSSPTNSDYKLQRNDSTKSINNDTIKPIVHIEEASDGSNTDIRKVTPMKSFSRTPSPHILSASSSQSSLIQSGGATAQIYECLERLTEPSVYRSRLNTAISERDIQSCVSPSPCRSPVTTSGVGILDRSPIGGEKVQYASLMQELQQQFLAKRERMVHNQLQQHQQQQQQVVGGSSPPVSAASDSVTMSDKSSRQESSRTDPKSSDAEFSKELEAALQLIQDLESPNTTGDTPSEPCCGSTVGNDANETVASNIHIHRLNKSVPNQQQISLTGVSGVWRRSQDVSESENEKTLSAIGSLTELTSPLTECLPELHTFKPPPTTTATGVGTLGNQGKSKSITILNTASDSQSTSGYSSPTHHYHNNILMNRVGHTPTLSNSSSLNDDGCASDILTPNKPLACSIFNTKTSAIISLRRSSIDINLPKRKSITLVHINPSEPIKVTPPKPPVRNQSIPTKKAQTLDRNVLQIRSAISLKDAVHDDEANIMKYSSGGSLNRLNHSSQPMWKVKSLLRKQKKTFVPPTLPPELEDAIVKSESLAFLSDADLLDRHERNIQRQRTIEQRLQQKLSQVPSESQC